MYLCGNTEQESLNYIFNFCFFQQAHHYFVIAAESGNANALAYLGKVGSSNGCSVVSSHCSLSFNFVL